MAKTWEKCKFCKKAYKSNGGGNLLCGLRYTAGDGLTAITRRQMAAEVNKCNYFEAKDPISDLNSLPGQVPTMAADGKKATKVNPVDVDPMKQPIWEIDTDALNPFVELPPIQTWAKMGERPAFPKEGITLIKAKPKQGKSFSVYALLIPLLTMKPLSTITPLERPRLVLVFDMEMSRTTLTNRVFKQMQLLAEDGKRFIVFPIKHLPLTERLGFIQSKVAMYSPDIVVIDQAGKLVANANDEVEATKVVNELEQMSIGRSVFAIQHENFGTENTKARGSVGSQLLFAQVEVYSSIKEKGVFTLKPEEARDTDTDNAATFTFALDNNGCIMSAESIIEAKSTAERESWRKDFAVIFGDDEELRRKDIIDRIVNGQGVTPDGAKWKVDKAAAIGAIIKVREDRNSPYKLVVNFS